MSFARRPPNSHDEFLTIAEVAAHLRVNPQTVRNWIDQGSLPAVCVGQRRVRVTRADLEHVIEQGYGSVAARESDQDPNRAQRFGTARTTRLPSWTRALEAYRR